MTASISDAEILKLVSPGYLTAGLKREDLSNRLKKISALMSSLEESDGDIKAKICEKKGLKDALVSDFIMKNQSEEIRLLCACCLADVLRLTAPVPPFQPKELEAIFKLILEQFKIVANSTSGSYKRAFYLLECIAVVRCYLMLTDPSIERGQEILKNMFDLFFEVASDSHNFANREIMCNCLEEFDEIPEIIIESLIARLSKKSSNSKSYLMACEVIKKESHKLEHPISKYLIDSYVKRREYFSKYKSDENKSAAKKSRKKKGLDKVKMDENSDQEKLDESSSEESDNEKEVVLKDKTMLSNLVLELSRIMPEALLQLMPQLQDYLTACLFVENLNERLDLVKMLGNLFTSDSKFGHEYTSLLHAFFRRFGDVDVQVRLKVVEFSKQLLLFFPSDDILIDFLSARLEDSDDSVRTRTVEVVASIAKDSLEIVPLVLLQGLSSRVADKRDDIVRITLECLCKIFRSCCFEYWRRNVVLPESYRKYLWIPKKISAMLSQDTMRRILFEEIIDEFLFDKSLSIEEKSRCFVGFYAALEEKGKSGVHTSFFEAKYGIQMAMSELLKFRDNRGEKKNDSEFQNKKMKFLNTIINSIFCKSLESEESFASRKEHILKLVDHPDNNVQKFLATCCDSLSSLKDLTDAKKEIMRTVGVQSDVTESQKLFHKNTVHALLTRLCMNFISVDSISYLVEGIFAAWSSDQDVLCSSGLSLLKAFSVKFPNVLANQVSEILKLILYPANSEFDASRVTDAIQILAISTASEYVVSKVSKSLSREIVNNLREFTLSGSPEQAGFSVTVIHHLLSPGHHSNTPIVGKSNVPLSASCSSYFVSLTSEILKGVEFPFHNNLGTLLSSLASIVLELPDFLPEMQKSNTIDPKWCVTFVLDKLLPFYSEELQKFVTSAKIYGVKLLVNLVLSRNIVATNLVSTIYKSFFKIVENQGTVSVKNAATTPEMQEELDGVFIAVVKGFLDLASIPDIEKVLQPIHFNTLCYAAHAESSNVRAAFVIHAIDLLRRNLIPFRYSAILVLAASVPEEDVAANARVTLEQLVFRQRELSKLYQAKYKTTPPPYILPEFFLGELIHVLSHHPDFDRSREDFDSTVLNFYAKFLLFYIDALLKNTSVHNLAFINEVITLIRSSKDATESSNDIPNTFYLADLAALIIKEKMNVKNRAEWLTTKYPIQIVLDPSLYLQGQLADSKLKLIPSNFKIHTDKRKDDSVVSPVQKKRSAASPSSRRAAGSPSTEPSKKAKRIRSKATKKLSIPDEEEKSDGSEGEETKAAPVKETRKLPLRNAKAVASVMMRSQVDAEMDVSEDYEESDDDIFEEKTAVNRANYKSKLEKVVSEDSNDDMHNSDVENKPVVNSVVKQIGKKKKINPHSK